MIEAGERLAEGLAVQAHRTSSLSLLRGLQRLPRWLAPYHCVRSLPRTGSSAFLVNVKKPALGRSFSVKYGDQVSSDNTPAAIASEFRKVGFAPR